MSSPGIAPDIPYSVMVHTVLDDFGKLGRSWRELDENATSERDIGIVRTILSGEFNEPVQVVAFNVTEGWCRDVTEDIARAAADLAREKGHRFSKAAQNFYEHVTHDDSPRDVARVD
jgi:hypothetical protein